MDQREIKKEQWKELAKTWATYSPPIRPSKNEIRFYEEEIKKLCKKNRKLKALILGATPEFRDLLSRYNIATTLIDINPVSVKAMTSLLKIRKNPKEKIVLADWLNMPFQKNSFDIVFSDCAHDNLNFTEFGKFFESVKSVLKADGTWFFSAAVGYKKLRMTFNEFIELYKKSPRKFKDVRHLVFYIFRICYNPEFYDKKTRIFDFKKMDDKIREFVEKGRLPENALKDLVFGLDYQQVIIDEAEFKRIMKNSFDIIREYRDKSHPAMAIKWTAILKAKK